MNRNELLLAVLAGALISGCASMETPAQGADAKEDRTTVTGSHIPRKPGSTNVQTMDAQSVQDSAMRGAISPATGAK